MFSSFMILCIILILDKANIIVQLEYDFSSDFNPHRKHMESILSGYVMFI